MLKTFIVKTVTYKPEVLMPLSAALTVITTMMELLLNTSIFGISALLIIQTCVLFTIDFVFGIQASRAGSDYKGIESTKITYTIIKFLVLFIWIWMTFSIEHHFSKIEWFQTFLSPIITFPIFLINLREFVSIGESLEKVYKKKPYIFTLVDKVFDAVERLFISKIDNNGNNQTE